jgi:hypothetical protein
MRPEHHDCILPRSSRAGGHSPGLFILPQRFSIADVLEFLVLAAHASDPWEWYDQIMYYP